MHSEKLK
jgi:hypothetical protein